MKCFICGEEFDEDKIEGVPFYNLDNVKNVRFKDQEYRPCQRCLLPFLEGIKLGIIIQTDNLKETR